MKVRRTHSEFRLSIFALVLALICSAGAFAQTSPINAASTLPAGLPAAVNGAPQQSGVGWDVLSYSLNGTNPSYEVNGTYVPAFGTLYRGNGDSYNNYNNNLNGNVGGYETWTATYNFVAPAAFTALNNAVYGKFATPSTSGAVVTNVGNFWCGGGTAQGNFAGGPGAPLASTEVFCWAGDWTTVEAVSNNNWLKGETIIGGVLGAQQPVVNQMGLQCEGCHGHSTIDGYDGPAYLTSGHKNGLRKVVPGEPLSGSNGQTYSSGIDYATGDTVTIDWLTGKATDTTTGVTKTALYTLAGWVNPNPYVITDNSSTNYGCFRCHATGYNFKANNTETDTTDGFPHVGPDAFNLGTGYTTWSGPEPTSVAWKQTTENGTVNAFTFATIPEGTGVGEIHRVPDTMVGMTTPPSSSWYLTGVRCERCHAGAYATPNGADIGNILPTAANPVYEKDGPTGGSASVSGTWPTAPANMQATALCMQCHRQEAINPGSGSTPGSITIPSKPIAQDQGTCSISTAKTYAACNTASGTWSYKPTAGPWAWQGQEFLASPHAMFNPSGNIQLVAQNTGDLTLLEGPGTLTDPLQYSSFNATDTTYQSAGVTGLSGMANNGCIGCHDAHETTVNGPQSVTNQTFGVLPNETAPLPNGTAASSTPTTHNCDQCHPTIAANLNSSVAHPKGTGTPFPYGAQTNPDTACFICHMNGQSGVAGAHLFQINPDPTYYTYPQTAAAFYAEAAPINGSSTSFVPMTTYNNGRWNNAVGLDVDIACGQCHGGGDGSGPNPYGLTLPNPAPPTFTRAFLAQAAQGMHNTSFTAPPEISLISGTYTGTQPVTITAQAGAAIYYTLGVTGTTPTPSSTPYTGAISVTATSVLEAIAVDSTGSASLATTATYTIAAPAAVVATPTFSEGTGYYTGSQSVTLSDATSGAGICYATYVPPATAPTAPTTTGDTTCKAGFTLNSTTPLPAVSTTETVIAYGIGTASNPTLKDSAAASATYTLGVAVPTFSVAAGQYNTAQSLSLVDLTPGAVICYNETTGAGTPATPTITPASLLLASPNQCATGTQFTGTAINIPLGSETNVVAIAGAAGMINSLPTANTKYNVSVATPSFNTLGTGTYPGTQSITLLDLTSPATICYTTYAVGGTTPTVPAGTATTCTGTTYPNTYSGPISVSSTEVIAAFAFGTGTNGSLANSAAVTATYTINTTTPAPVFSLAAGTYGGPQSLTLSDSLAGTVIYYTTDGSTPTIPPTGTTTLYTAGIPIPAFATTVVNAIAGGIPGMNNSTVTGPVVYNPPVTPTIAPYAQTYPGPMTVTISDLTSNASIYYSTTGVATCSSTPYPPAGITVSTTTTISAIACVGSVPSGTVSSTYTIAVAATVPPPTFIAPNGAQYYASALQYLNPGPGGTLTSSTYVATLASPLEVALSDTNGSAIICYTTNNSTPTVVAGPVCGNGTKFTANIPVSANETITAVAGTGGSSSTAAVLSLKVTKAVQ